MSIYATTELGVRAGDLPRQLSPFSCGAHGSQAAVAVAGRIVRDMDHLPGVLPDCIVARLSSGALAGYALKAARASGHIWSAARGRIVDAQPEYAP